MNKKSKRKKKKSKLRFLKYFFILLLSLLVLAIAAGGIFYLTHKQQIADIEKICQDKLDSINADTFKQIGATTIYDKDNNVIGKLSAQDYVYTKSSDIPVLMKDAFIATEDADFYSNNGISIKGMARAVLVAIKNKGKATQGGSTITQQLVKNVLLTQDKTMERKYTEILLSIDLNKMYTKEQILEYYLNNINFANGSYSVATASQMYFNKPMDKLTLAETTFLAAIPNNPTYYNPLKYYNHVVERQRLMLDNMNKQGYITNAQYNDALNQKVVLNYQPHKNLPESYMTSYAIDCAVRVLMQQNGFVFRYKFSSVQDENQYKDIYKDMYEEYDKVVRKGGYNIYTTLDNNKQKILQKAVNDNLSGFKDIDKTKGIYKMQAAAVSIDNVTGQVIAIVGGREQNGVANSFNRGFLAVRQPGSAIKPLLVYTPHFDKGGTPEDIVEDKEIPNGPKNAENMFFGNVTIRYATELSLNTVAFQVLQKEGVNYGLGYLEKMGFANITKQDTSPILAIGGFTKGATPLEMAGAYATLARGGNYIQPTCISKLTLASGEAVYDNPKIKVPVYKPESTYNMTDVLKGVLTQQGATAYGLALDKMVSAGKTGTTSDSKDGWFAGYTPYITTVVWAGYDIPTAISDLYGATYPGSIWKAYMNEVSKGQEKRDFDIPADVQQAMDEKQKAAEQAILTSADTAVAAYEAIHIKSAADISAATSALNNAQAAVSKLPKDQQPNYQNRINAKTADLEKEKGTVNNNPPITGGTVNNNSGTTGTTGAGTVNNNSGNTGTGNNGPSKKSN